MAPQRQPPSKALGFIDRCAGEDWGGGAGGSAVAITAPGAISRTSASTIRGVTTSIRAPAGMPANDFSSTFTWGSRLAWNLVSQSVTAFRGAGGRRTVIFEW